MMKPLHRFWSLLLLLTCWTLLLPAAPVDVATARSKAAQLLRQREGRSLQADALQLDYASPNGYLFSTATDFVLMAADDALPEVLGYGSRGTGTMPLALSSYLQTPKSVHGLQQQSFRPVPPLLTTVRHQNVPYNGHCPLYKDPNGVVTPYHCLVGCVATALEQVVTYYRREVVLLDTLHGWETPDYVIDDVLPGTRVDCRRIRNNYDTDPYTDAELDAVSRLSYYCGVAAHMRWGLNSSGANVHRLVKPMKRAFGYRYVKFVDSYEYAPADWVRLMDGELQAGRPVLYAAFNMWLGGHAFVVDGVDAHGYFHVNWGDRGAYDGYFRLDVLNMSEPLYDPTPEGSEAGFFCNHQALLLCPDAVDTALPDTLARTGGEIAIDSIVVDRAAETGKHTPMRVYFRNTTDRPLTTPFEYFTNLPTDTAVFDQADYVALSGHTLAPYEQRLLRLHADFHETGQRIFRVSPDGDTVIFELPLEVREGEAPQLTFHQPEVSFPEPGRARMTLRVSNADGAGYAGQELIYEVGPGAPQTLKDGVRHSRHLYVDPGTTVTDTVSFCHLQPGQTYALLIRSPWNVQQQTTFVVPDATGIVPPSLPQQRQTVRWYLPDGRAIDRPLAAGIYLRRVGRKTEKVYIK